MGTNEKGYLRKSYTAKTYGLFIAKITRLNMIFNYKKKNVF